MLMLVTGAAGFIGSHLCEKLLELGYDVVGFDSFLDYYPRHIKEHNLTPVLTNPKFKFIEGDILRTDLDKLLDGVSGVFHHAAIAGVRSSWGERFSQYVDNNVLATQLLLESCLKQQVDKLVYASSSSVYGDAKVLPVKENSPTLPHSPYGVTKLAGENLVHLYHKNYEMQVVSLRYFTIYGPRQRPDMGFHKFLYRIIKGREIEIFGDGEQTRDFTYIDSAVEANVKAFENGVSGEAYNIGGGTTIKLTEAISLIEGIAGKYAKLKFVDPQKGDVNHTFSDCGKAENDFGYAPTHSLEEGLREHYEYLKANIDIYG